MNVLYYLLNILNSVPPRIKSTHLREKTTNVMNIVNYFIIVSEDNYFLEILSIYTYKC